MSHLRFGSNCSATRSSGSAISTRSQARCSPPTAKSSSTRPSTTSCRPRRSTTPSAVSGPSWTSDWPNLRSAGKLLEAQRLQARTMYDLEMIQEVGYCSGIENYARHLAGLPAGAKPYTLVDYFPERLSTVHRRIARDASPVAGDVGRRPQPQRSARRARLPPAQRLG